MSYFDEASLVMIPSGYKEDKIYSIKPTDGSGDLTFSRSNDTATRVNSDGLIEKVRTNVATYSQDFNNWAQTAVTITPSATANPLDGLLNAQNITPTATLGVHRLLKFNSGGENSTNTWSIYAKANGYNFLFLVENGNTGANVSFNLSTGVVSQENSAVGQIESLANGWYRCSMVHTTTTSPRFDIYISPTDSLSGYTADGTSGVILFGAQAEVSDLGPTDYIATTTAAVSVGPVANLPRLDYLDSSCPKLLLEPQRTNSLTYSEAFDNAGWGKLYITVSPNTSDTIDPSGYYGADKITDNATVSSHVVFQAGQWDTTQRTASVYAKAGTSSKVSVLNISLGTGVFADLSAGTISVSAGFTGTLTNVGNGWYRITATHTAATAQTFSIGLFTGTNTSSYGGTGSYAYIWGAQIEEGSYATSYIPTLSAASTRGADSAIITGLDTKSIITDNDSWTAFFELELLGNDSPNDKIQLSDNSDDPRAYLYASTAGVAATGWSGSELIAMNTNNKIIYRANTSKDISFFENGVDEGSFITTTGDELIFNRMNLYGSNGAFKVKQVLLFPTALTDSECIALTTL